MRSLFSLNSLIIFRFILVLGQDYITGVLKKFSTEGSILRAAYRYEKIPLVESIAERLIPVELK